MPEKKEEIENRLGLLITISVFFPVLLYNLSKVTGAADSEAFLLTIQTSTLIGFYVLNYILFQIQKDSLSAKSLKQIGGWLLVSLGVFIVPIFGIALGTVRLPIWISLPIAFISSTGILLVLFLPPLIEIIILFSGVRKNKI